VIICDLCGKATEGLQKEIDGKEYDFCSECWNALEQKLKGKGRAINREILFLPPLTDAKEREHEGPLPGEPPKIWGAA
jgi:ribosome-binding protein aMBF1 (putative translation factor)